MVDKQEALLIWGTNAWVWAVLQNCVAMATVSKQHADPIALCSFIP